jgi:hypothetical protein
MLLKIRLFGAALEIDRIIEIHVVRVNLIGQISDRSLKLVII